MVLGNVNKGHFHLFGVTGLPHYDMALCEVDTVEGRGPKNVVMSF